MDPVKTKENNDYISNPFRLVVASTKRLFNTNKNWAILILVLGMLSSFSSIGKSTKSSTTPVGSNVANTDVSTVVATVIIITVVVLVVSLLVSVLAVYIQGVLTYVALQSEKGQKATLSEATAAVRKRFGRLYWSQLLALVKIIGWTMLFIVPGIIASLRYALLGYVIMDESENNKSVKESHIRVKTLVNTRLWEVLGVSSTGIIPVFGTLFDVTGKAAQYNQLKKYHDQKLEKPKVHWLNYVMLIVFSAIFLAVVAMGIIFLLIRSNN